KNSSTEAKDTGFEHGIQEIEGTQGFPHEPSILGISLRRLLSKGTVRHPRPLSSLKTSVTSSKKTIKIIPGVGKTMADHSQNWHDGSSNKNIDSSSNSEGIVAIVRKLDSLGRDIKKLKENVHVIQVGCQLCGGPHLDMECPLNEEVKNLGASINIMPLSMYKHLGTGKLKPINMMIEMADYTKCNPKGIIENLLVKIIKFIFSVDFVIHDMVEDFRIPIILRRPFLATAHTKSERFREEENDIKENIKDLEECEDDKSHVIMEAIHDKLNDDWFKDTSKDEDDLEGIIDYLEPRSYDGFTDLDDEAYGSLSQEEEFEVTPTRIHVPSQDFTRSLVPPSGSKGLLHMLNAIMIPTKDTRVKSSSLAIITQKNECNVKEQRVRHAFIVVRLQGYLPCPTPLLESPTRDLVIMSKNVKTVENVIENESHFAMKVVNNDLELWLVNVVEKHLEMMEDPFCNRLGVIELDIEVVEKHLEMMEDPFCNRLGVIELDIEVMMDEGC
nr:hypothetical protein [Tanacetum cinerariifolium]